VKIIVTGGSGFIGSHLTRRLLSDGHAVVVVDNFHTGRKENINHLFDEFDLEIRNQDVTEPFQIEADRIYNLACPASPIHYQRSPVNTVLTSVMGCINVLNCAKQMQARVLQASTSEVYGDPTCHPQREDYWGNVNPVGLRSCYDEGKRVAETIMTDYQREHHLDVRIARIFNTYGPHMRPDDGRVISNFIVQALQNKPITIYGDGAQTRSFCYVDDMVEGLVGMMESNSISGPVNLGNPDERRILDIARNIMNITGSTAEIEFKPLPDDDPLRRCPDITRAQTLLRWQPPTDFEQGLAKTVDYFRTILQSHESPCQAPS
jgi:UDP-glucuronate decarboxylase